MRRTMLAALVLVVSAFVAGAVWLAAGDDHREGAAARGGPAGDEHSDGTVPTGVVDAEVIDAGLSIAVGSCNQNPTAEVVENDETVTVTAFAPPPGDDVDGCADGLVLRLEQPIGDRMIIDGATGMTIAARRPGWVSGGDDVRIVGDYTRSGETSDAAVWYDGPQELAEMWPQTAAPGPAPTFEGDESDAIVIRLSDPSVCADLSELMIVDGNLLRFQQTDENGDERPCTAPPQSGQYRVVVALVPERSPGQVPEGMAERLEAVSYRDRLVPLAPADAAWPTSPTEPSPARTSAGGIDAWWIENQPPCPPNAACDVGVFIGTSYYPIRCDTPTPGHPLDGELYAVGSAAATEARTFPGADPLERVAMLLADDVCPLRPDRWVEAFGEPAS